MPVAPKRITFTGDRLACATAYVMRVAEDSFAARPGVIADLLAKTICGTLGDMGAMARS